jgi:hypothetical protein
MPGLYKKFSANANVKLKIGSKIRDCGRGDVSAKQSPAYQSMPQYETISKRLEKLQVSFSRKAERM